MTANFTRRNLLDMAATGGAAVAVAATAVKPALAQDNAPRAGKSGEKDYDVFDSGDLVLQSGITLPRAKLAYKTYGKLAATRDNAVLMPTYYGGRHINNEAMIGAGRALDPLARRVRAQSTSAASRSAAVSRRRMRRASPPRTITAGGRGMPL